MNRTGQLALTLFFALPLAACGGGSNATARDNAPVQVAEQNDDQPAPDAEVEPCPEGDSQCRVERLGNERLKWIELGLKADAVVDELGEPTQKSEVFEEGATGLFISTWSYPTLGIQLDMAAEVRDGPMTVNSATISAPSKLTTSREIGIGSSEADVKTAYEGLADPDFTEDGTQFVAGSVYGGVFFYFEDGKVSSIFLGAGAE